MAEVSTQTGRPTVEAIPAPTNPIVGFDAPVQLERIAVTPGQRFRAGWDLATLDHSVAEIWYGGPLSLEIAERAAAQGANVRDNDFFQLTQYPEETGIRAWEMFETGRLDAQPDGSVVATDAEAGVFLGSLRPSFFSDMAKFRELKEQGYDLGFQSVPEIMAEMANRMRNDHRNSMSVLQRGGGGGFAGFAGGFVSAMLDPAYLPTIFLPVGPAAGVVRAGKGVFGATRTARALREVAAAGTTEQLVHTGVVLNAMERREWLGHPVDDLRMQLANPLPFLLAGAGAGFRSRIADKATGRGMITGPSAANMAADMRKQMRNGTLPPNTQNRVLANTLDDYARAWERNPFEGEDFMLHARAELQAQQQAVNLVPTQVNAMLASKVADTTMKFTAAGQRHLNRLLESTTEASLNPLINRQVPRIALLQSKLNAGDATTQSLKRAADRMEKLIADNPKPDPSKLDNISQVNKIRRVSGEEPSTRKVSDEAAQQEIANTDSLISTGAFDKQAGRLKKELEVVDSEMDGLEGVMNNVAPVDPEASSAPLTDVLEQAVKDEDITQGLADAIEKEADRLAKDNVSLGLDPGEAIRKADLQALDNAATRLENQHADINRAGGRRMEFERWVEQEGSDQALQRLARVLVNDISNDPASVPIGGTVEGFSGHLLNKYIAPFGKPLERTERSGRKIVGGQLRADGQKMSKDMLEEFFGGNTGNKEARALANEFAEAWETTLERMVADGAVVPGTKHLPIKFMGSKLHQMRRLLAKEQGIAPDGEAATDLLLARVKQDLEGWIDDPSVRATMQDEVDTIIKAEMTGGASNLAAKVETLFTLHLDTAEGMQQFLTKYGHNDLTQNLIEHFKLQARWLAFNNITGHTPQSLKVYAAQLSRKPGAQTKGIEGSTILAAGKTGRVVQEMINEAAGIIDVRSWTGLGRFAAAARNIIVGLKLSGAGLTAALTDPAFSLSSAMAHGVRADTFFVQYAKNIAKGSRRDVLDTYLAADYYTRQVVEMARITDVTADGGWTSTFAAATMRLSGLTRHTTAVRTSARQAYALQLSRELMKDYGNITPAFRRTLDAAGIDADDWVTMRSVFGRTKIMDEPYFFIQDLAEATEIPVATRNTIAAKLDGIMEEFAGSMAPQPGMRMRAGIRAGLETGTFTGEIIRSMMQFKSFQFFLNTLLWHKRKSPIGGWGRYILPMAINSTLAGYVLNQSRAVLRGQDVEGISVNTLVEGFLSSGAAPVYLGDLAMSMINAGTGRGFGPQRSGEVIGFGPGLDEILRTIDAGSKVIGRVSRGQDPLLGYELLRQVKRWTPYNNLFYTKTFMDRYFWLQAEQMVDPVAFTNSRLRAQAQAYERNGVTYWWGALENEPDRAPAIAE